METVTYKIIQGYYKEVVEEELILPVGIKLLYEEGVIGDSCHKGHNHFMGIIRKNDYNDEELDDFIDDNTNILPYNFSSDYLLIILRDIKFIDEPPLYKNSEEFMSEFNVRDYYISNKTKDELDSKFYDEIKPGMEYNIYDYIKPGKVYNVVKILNIKGPNSVSTFTVSNGNSYGREMYGMIREDNVDIVRLIENFNNNTRITINKEGKEDFERIKNEVLLQIEINE